MHGQNHIKKGKTVRSEARQVIHHVCSLCAETQLSVVLTNGGQSTKVYQ